MFNKDNKSKKEGKDQVSIQSSFTTDPGYQWESDNFPIRRQKREPRGKPFPNNHFLEQALPSSSGQFFAM